MEKLTEEQTKMVEDNLAFVTYVAKKYFNKNDYVYNQDIIQEGIYAMSKAMPNYNEDKGKLTTYFYPTIDGHLKRYVYYQNRLIPIPHQKHLKKETIAKAEIAKNVYSLDLKYKNNSSSEEEYTLMHIIPDKKTENTEDILVNKIIVLDAIRTQLSWKERIVITYRYYFDLSQTKIAELMQLSQVHVHRIEKRALIKIEAYINN